MICPQCGDSFEDEHGHGLCFGCKVQSLRFGSVRQGPSIWALEKAEVEAARAVGIEPERRTEPAQDRSAERRAKAERELKKLTTPLREKVRSG